MYAFRITQSSKMSIMSHKNLNLKYLKTLFSQNLLVLWKNKYLIKPNNPMRGLSSYLNLVAVNLRCCFNKKRHWYVIWETTSIKKKTIILDFCNKWERWGLKQERKIRSLPRRAFRLEILSKKSKYWNAQTPHYSKNLIKQLLDAASFNNQESLILLKRNRQLQITTKSSLNLQMTHLGPCLIINY